MSDLLERLRERKLVQWALAYLAGAWVAVEGMASVGDVFGLSVMVQRLVIVALGFGLVLTMVLAWYHGEKGRQRVSGPELLILAGVLVVAGGTLTVMGRSGEVADPAAAPESSAVDPSSVAILPFADLSPEGDQAYFGEGVAEELRSVLSRIPGLRVASTTSSNSVVEGGLDPAQIGARLGVANLVEGSVRKSRDRLRVEARLVGAADGFQRWSGRFDGAVEDIFSVQDSIALAVARALEIRLSGGGLELEARGQTADHEAQDLYLQGRYAWGRRSRADLEAAVSLFQRAVERDPEYARALVGLGDAYAVLGFYDFRPPAEAFPLAQESARAALQIDSTLAEAYATLGYAALYYDWDFDASEENFRRAIALDSRYPIAHQWYSNLLVAKGDLTGALDAMREASELDPLSTVAVAAVGWVHMQAGDCDHALRQFEATLARDDDFELAYLWGGACLAHLGRYDEAVEWSRRSLALSGGSGISQASLARVLALAGRGDEAREVLEALEEAGQGEYVPSYEIAAAHVALGDGGAAMAWLERAVEERSHSIAFLGVDAQFDPIRGRPDFERLLASLGLG